MSGQVMVITSALAGIGRTTALAAAGQGGKIVLSGRNSQTGSALEAELRALGRPMAATSASAASTWLNNAASCRRQSSGRTGAPSTKIIFIPTPNSGETS